MNKLYKYLEMIDERRPEKFQRKYRDDGRGRS